MPAITVKFERDVSNTHTFANVTNVTWGHEFVRDFMVDPDSGIGHKITNFQVKGFIIKHGDPSHNVAEQEALETSLRNVGVGTLSYTGATDVENVRFTSLEFDEYRGGTVSRFTAKFVTESTNVAAYDPVTIGVQALTLSEGFELPEVTDSYASQAKDVQIKTNLSRAFTVTGRIVAATLDGASGVNAIQAKLVAAVANKDNLVLDISSSMNGESITVRPISLNFSSSEKRLGVSARTYRFECEAYDDYDQEPYSLGEGALTLFTGAEQTTVDVVESYRHTYPSTEREATVYSAQDERVSVSGKKYFADWNAYNTFVNRFVPFPPHKAEFIWVNSVTGNILQLVDASVGAITRDGHFPGAVPNAKRYSATVSFEFRWNKSVSQQSQHFNTQAPNLILGINWYRITSTSHSFTINERGDVTSRSVNLSGRIFDSNLLAAKALIGTPVDIGSPMSNIPGAQSAQYYITNVSISNTDIEDSDTSGVTIPVTVHDVSVSAQQLDSATKRTYFLHEVFNTTGSPLVFNRVTSRSKSIANRLITEVSNANYGKYKVTSINMSISGEVWETDNNGAPNNVNRAYAFFEQFDGAYENIPTGGPPQNLPTYPDTDPLSGAGTPAEPRQLLMPGLAGTPYHFFVNSINVGEWQPAVKPDDHGASGTKGDPIWVQTISISATVVFDITASGGGSEPDYIDSTSEIINEQTTKFTEIRVMGAGTVFKAIGINPSTAQTTITRQFRDKNALEQNGPTKGTKTPTFPSGWPFTASGDNEPQKDSFEIRGLSARWIKSWIATKEE